MSPDLSIAVSMLTLSGVMAFALRRSLALPRRPMSTGKTHAQRGSTTATAQSTVDEQMFCRSRAEKLAKEAKAREIRARLLKKAKEEAEYVRRTYWYVNGRREGAPGHESAKTAWVSHHRTEVENARRELGIAVGVRLTPESLSEKYRELALKHHPDRHIGKPNAEEHAAKFIRVKDANETLMRYLR